MLKLSNFKKREEIIWMQSIVVCRKNLKKDDS